MARIRRLGSKGPEVSALGLGCMGMSEAYGPIDESEALATFERAFELGIRFLDTADAYGPHTNERLVGRFMRGRRQEIFLSTKFGITPATSADGALIVNGHPSYVRKCCHESLERLDTDFIDLYYLHRLDPTVPIEDTVGAMSQLVTEGKVRFLGLSEVNSNTIRRADAVHKITAVQSEYSLWTRDPEQGVLPTCRELSIGFVPFSPLGRGFLSGAIKTVASLSPGDARQRYPRFQGVNLDRNLLLVRRLSVLANNLEATPAQVALAWLLYQGDHIVPIPGTKRRQYLEDNVKSIELRLPVETVEELNLLFSAHKVSGERYPEFLMKSVQK